MKKLIQGKVSDESYNCKISKVKRVFCSTKITAGTNLPKVGIFWLIGDELVVINEGIDKNYNPLAHDDVLHIEAWKAIKNRYKVDGKVVRYDYFPRGRVMIYPVKDINGDFKYYDCDVYGDKCIISDDSIRDEIESEFRLYLSTCKVSYKGQLSVDGTHYTCHNCRG
ncbi:MAG: hypothetical protein NC177_16475 [Ruminococcus flavefaciens]|nr:hypothetical protein [Ruminococcus flavefaciens]